MAQQTPQPRMLRGDEAHLFAAHELALRAAVRHHANTSDAIIEDACSFAWLQLMRHQPDRDTVFAWLRTVAIREAWRLHKRARRDDHLQPEHDRPGTHSLELVLDARDALNQVAQLPARQRTYLTAKLAGHSYDEIATLHGATHRTIDRHLKRARRTLRRPPTTTT